MVNLNDLVRESHRILERMIGEDVELRIDLDASHGPVKVDPGQIAQVFMNLAVNAATVQLPPGQYVLVNFGDTGVGMGEVHLLRTDTILPGIGGPELPVRLAALHPKTRTLFISGYTGSTVFRNGMLKADSRFLQKPFSARALTQRIKDVLGRRRKD